MQTPSLASTLLQMTEARLTGLNTMLPGIVVAVDIAAGKCDVQPLLQRINSDGVAVTLPVISNCPIGFYRAGDAGVFIPLKVGHNVEIRFCQRSLDIWLSKGGTVDPSDARLHHLSDAVVYPGLYPLTSPPANASPDNLVVVNGSGKIEIFPDGKIKFDNGTGSTEIDSDGKYTFTNGSATFEITSDGKFKIQGASDELLTIVSDLIDKLTQVKTPTMLGPEPFLSTDIIDLEMIKARVDGLKE